LSTRVFPFWVQESTELFPQINPD